MKKVTARRLIAVACLGAFAIIGTACLPTGVTLPPVSPGAGAACPVGTWNLTGETLELRRERDGERHGNRYEHDEHRRRHHHLHLGECQRNGGRERERGRAGVLGQLAVGAERRHRESVRLDGDRELHVQRRRIDVVLACGPDELRAVIAGPRRPDDLTTMVSWGRRTAASSTQMTYPLSPGRGRHPMCTAASDRWWRVLACPSHAGGARVG